ncbi:N-alpha-acetyltransferase 35, NatC auxiliary subunit [Eurytemora carolleeae]|uniref:N-alpha-acetyltransferase 35, NatC auxiliary subunit n=1 Tax=Eurytemora carolleeae TaxID=1294199 RepID=UPI000C7880FC|nr:N-alpha-acetyltransferase 35, NatC auxiliary subunit [Eurytemora carolleeae]|eukprot:XP_023336183.1 N-alpha-acetyltransferase 35, NatC auxiliary subunit-like [Eurytemora affinis]
MYTCIASRLKFLRLFYLGLTSLEKGEVTEGYRLISGSRDQLTSILSTVSLGTCPAAGQNMLGFDPGANQRLLPPTFPRFTKTRDRSTAVKYYQDLTNNVLLVCGVNSIQGFHSLLNFFQEFSSRSPCLLSRSLLQILYSPLGLNQSYPSSPNPSTPRNHPVLQDILQESCKGFLAPAALLPPPPCAPGQPASPLHTLQVREYCEREGADTTISEHIAAQENKKKGKKKNKVGGKKNVRSRPYSLEIAGYQTKREAAVYPR